MTQSTDYLENTSLKTLMPRVIYKGHIVLSLSDSRKRKELTFFNCNLITHTYSKKSITAKIHTPSLLRSKIQL